MLSYLRDYKLFSKCMYTKVISFNSFLYDSTNLKANAVLRSNPSEFHLSDFFFQGSSSTESRASYRFFYTSFHVRSLFGWLRVIDSALTKKGFHSKLEMSHITQDSYGYIVYL